MGQNIKNSIYSCSSYYTNVLCKELLSCIWSSFVTSGLLKFCLAMDFDIVYAYAAGFLDEEELFLLDELENPRRRKPEFPYYNYDAFNLDTYTSDESYINFRFFKDDIPRVMAGLNIPEQITTHNRVNVSGTEAFCLLLRRLAYPCRLYDVAREFGQRPIPVLSVTINHMLDYVYDNFALRLLTTLDQPWLSPDKLLLESQGIP